MRFPRLDFPQIDSTNSEAARRATKGERGPLWITAQVQTAGRGRQGRAWQAGQGNLTATLLLTIEKFPAQAAQLAFVAALAAGDLAAAFVAPDLVTLKWPNDVLIGGAKACGVLIETGTAPGGGLWLAVGIGANLASAPADTPYPATSLAAHGQTPSVEAALDVLDSAFAYWLETWDGEGFEPVRAAWIARGHRLGQTATVGDISGVIEGIDADGALLLRVPAGTVRRITAGDVIFGDA